MKKVYRRVLGVITLIVAATIQIIGFSSGEAAAKPASPIMVTCSAPEKNSVGKEIQISIAIRVPAEIKELALQLLPEEGLTLKTPAGATVKYGDRPEGVSLTETVTIIASKEGRLFLNVFASGVFNGKKTVSTVSVPVDIGDAKKPMTKQGRDVTDSSGRELIVVPAEEPKKQD